MKGKKHSKRLAAFMLALVLIATTVINPGSITSVFAETAEEAKTASEKKTEAEKKEEPTTKAKEETTTAKKEETTTKAKEEVTTAKKEETTTKAKEETTTAKKEETTTKAKEETTTTKKEETTKPEEGTTGNRSAKKLKTVGNPNAAGSSTEKDKTEEDKKEEEVKTYTVSSGTYAKTCITLTDYQEAIKTLEAKGEYELADWMNLAFAYKCTGNWKKSKELLLQAVLYYPEDYRLYMRLCYLECELQDRKPQALKDYSQLKVYYDKAVSLLNGKTGNEEWIQLKSLIVQLKEYGWM